MNATEGKTKKLKFSDHNRIQHNRTSREESVFGTVDASDEYILYWLSKEITDSMQNYHMTGHKLRGIIDYLVQVTKVTEIFNENCQNIFIIMDSTYFEEVYDTLINKEQVLSIYVFNCHKNVSNSNVIRESASMNDKICGPFEDIDEMFIRIFTDVRRITMFERLNSSIPCLSSISKLVERSTTVNYSHVTDWYTYLIRALEEVPPKPSCKDEFINECRILYRDQPTILRVVEQFSENYLPVNAIEWYTRDGFLYKVLNKSLREKNQKAIQMLHFLIHDLNAQLKTEFKSNKQQWMRSESSYIYRGQLMSLEELEQLKKSQGETVFVNSFLSTTTDLSVAQMFSGSGNYRQTDPIQSVIFHIDWGDSNPREGLADIHNLSYNRDEGEILLSPTCVLNFLDCTFDEINSVWNAKFTRLATMDDPLIRIHDDEYLMRLELILVYFMDKNNNENDDASDIDSETSSSMSLNIFSQRNHHFGIATVMDDIILLQQEIEVSEQSSITLMADDSDRFQLKMLRNFNRDSMNENLEIFEIKIHYLYDSLGTIFKKKGNLLKAYYYYQKAATYDKPQSQTTYTRQMYLAQLHKLNGEYDLTWKIYLEMIQYSDDIDCFLFEDITFAKSKKLPVETFLDNSREFLEYCTNINSIDEDEDADDYESDSVDNDYIPYMIEAWAELGYRYFYLDHNYQRALYCYHQEKRLSCTKLGCTDISFNPFLGSCAERMGDLFTSKNETQNALERYQEALELSKKDTFVPNLLATARCMCKIALLNESHDSSLFYRALRELTYTYTKPYARDTIGKCLVCLARSLQRCKKHEEALYYAQLALTVFLRDPLMIEPLTDDCYNLTSELIRAVPSVEALPTLEEVFNNQKLQTEENIKLLLDKALERLERNINFDG